MATTRLHPQINRLYDGLKYRAAITPWLTMVPTPSTYAIMTSKQMNIVNMQWTGPAVRRLHLEVALSDALALQVVHAVCYPDPQFDLPIVGMDMVAVNGAVTMAIADASPTTPAFDIPSWYILPPAPTPAPAPDAAAARPIPEWGRGIFGDACVFLDRPACSTEFVDYALALMRMHIDQAEIAAAALGPEPVHAEARARRQAEYCHRQRQNPRTRAVLAKAFGAEMADAYMRDLMFDFSL